MEGAAFAPQQPGGVASRQGGDPFRVCLISLGGELYAINLRNVREVFEVEAITRVPGMPPALVGVANLRGIIVPLVDLRLMLGVSATEASLPFAVVVRHELRQLGVLVERVPEIRTVRKDQLLPAVHIGRTDVQRFVSAVIRMEEFLGGVLEIPMVFEQVESGGVALKSA